MPNLNDLLDSLVWLGHDGFAVSAGDVTVVIDPFQVEARLQADIVLVTHPHYDHCSVDDIRGLLKPTTVIVTESESAAKLAAAGITAATRVVRPGDRLEVGAIGIEVVPAYNVDKAFHPRDKNWLGFVVTIGGHRLYHSGDTDLIPEMAGLQVDIALLPVSGTYVMTAAEAAAAARRIGPRVAIPMHYAAIVGSVADARSFGQALAGVCEVVVPAKAGPAGGKAGGHGHGRVQSR